MPRAAQSGKKGSRFGDVSTRDIEIAHAAIADLNRYAAVVLAKIKESGFDGVVKQIEGGKQLIGGAGVHNLRAVLGRYDTELSKAIAMQRGHAGAADPEG